MAIEIITAERINELLEQVRTRCNDLGNKGYSELQKYDSLSDEYYTDFIEPKENEIVTLQHYKAIRDPMTHYHQTIANTLPDPDTNESIVINFSKLKTAISNFEKCDTCNGSCNINCSTTCTGGCKGSCSGGCSTTCSGGCKGNCGSGCTGGCSESCSEGCYTTCTGNCDSCGAECSDNCNGSCYGSCTATCTGMGGK